MFPVQRPKFLEKKATTESAQECKRDNVKEGESPKVERDEIDSADFLFQMWKTAQKYSRRDQN